MSDMEEVLIAIIGPNDAVPQGCHVGRPDGRGSPDHELWLVSNGFRWVYKSMAYNDNNRDCPLCPRGSHIA
jgi:hypothetical protein